MLTERVYYEWMVSTNQELRYVQDIVRNYISGHLHINIYSALLVFNRNIVFNKYHDLIR
jgi:hypothetical protein